MNKNETKIYRSSDNKDYIIDLLMSGRKMTVEELMGSKRNKGHLLWEILGCRECPLIEDGEKELAENICKRDLDLRENAYSKELPIFARCMTKLHKGNEETKVPCNTFKGFLARKNLWGRVKISELD